MQAVQRIMTVVLETLKFFKRKKKRDKQPLPFGVKSVKS